MMSGIVIMIGNRTQEQSEGRIYSISYHILPIRTIVGLAFGEDHTLRLWVMGYGLWVRIRVGILGGGMIPTNCLGPSASMARPWNR